jgi:acyl carrier protein
LTSISKLNSEDNDREPQLLLRSLQEAVGAAIDQLNQTLAPTQQLDKLPGTILVGTGAQLDSMAVVNFLVFLEDEIAARFERELDLIGADPFEPEDLKTVGSVTEALGRRLDA